MGRSTRGRAIVAAVTDLAHELGLSVTAEGVETERQQDEVRDIGCDHAQGFFFARPASATAMGALLGALHTGPRHLPTPKPTTVAAVLEKAESA
jgi:EAL domain-containing protein (putative c-di-GMP-specific phosphodiesterase class I)